MIGTYPYPGVRGPQAIGLGFLLLMRGGESAADATPTLVGQWSNVVALQTSPQRTMLTATNEKTRMEATDANNH
jgi:hypothetical protein